MSVGSRGRIVNVILDDLNIKDVVSVDVVLTVNYIPGDPGVYRYADGSGCPPTPDEVEIREALVHSVTGATYQFFGCNSREGWFEWLDEIVLREVEENEEYYQRVLELARTFANDR